MPVRRWLAGRAIPEYVAVGLDEPQSAVEARLRGPGVDLDVTFSSVLVSLRPLTLAVRLGPEGDGAAAAPLSLHFRERRQDAPWLGLIRLRPTGRLALPQGDANLFEAAGYDNHCVPRPRLWRFYLQRWWHRRRQHDNFRMSISDLHSEYVFYVCPRPVVLVTTVHEAGSNLFPMDLIGPTGGGDFLLALRSTSPAIRLMEGSRRLALSSMPLSELSNVYALGKHHRHERIDWESLPFSTRPSARFGLPVPCPAQAVCEVTIERIQVVGSHTVFVTTPAHTEQCGAGRRIFHISGLYQAYLERRMRSL